MLSEGVDVESDLSMSRTRCLVSTWTGTAVWTIETFTTRWSLNKHTTVLYFTALQSANLRNESSESVFHADVYRDRYVAERRAACSRDANSWSADGHNVNTSEGGGALINREMNRHVSDHLIRF